MSTPTPMIGYALSGGPQHGRVGLVAAAAGEPPDAISVHSGFAPADVYRRTGGRNADGQFVYRHAGAGKGTGPDGDEREAQP